MSLCSLLSPGSFSHFGSWHFLGGREDGAAATGAIQSGIDSSLPPCETRGHLSMLYTAVTLELEKRSEKEKGGKKCTVELVVVGSRCENRPYSASSMKRQYIPAAARLL